MKPESSVTNLSSDTISSEIDFTDYEAEYTNWFSKKTVNFSNTMKMELKPWEYSVWVK